MTITLKNTPPSINRFAGRANVHEYREEKERWTKAVYLTAKAAKTRPRTPYQRAAVEITYFFPNRNRRDPDNFAGKFLLDGLTMAGVIADDDFRHIRLSVAGEYDKHNPRTVIRVTGIGAEV